MNLRAALAAFALVFLGSAASAEASLSSSEKGQIRDFFSTARSENAVRVRSLVARTDLTAEESISALAEAVTPVPFTEPRGIFLRELVFGVSSASSRPLLAHAVTRALLARADAVYQKYVGGLDHEPAAIAELAGIYAFLDGAIANAGRPTLAAHDVSAGISAAAYGDCSKELRDHVEKNARWLKGDGVVAESVGRVRAQAQIALIDMLPDGLTRRVDAADRLGLKGPRRQILIDLGILFADTGKLDEPKLEQVRVALVRLPGARVDLGLLYAGDDRGPLRARGLVAYVGGASAAAGAAGGGAANGGASDASPFGEELTPANVDPVVSPIVQDLAVLAVKRAMDDRAELRLQAGRDAAATQSDSGRMLGKPRAPSVEHVVGAAAYLLLVDASRTIDLAAVRLLAGRPESVALLSDAVGALAAFAVTPGTSGLQLELAKSGAATTMGAIRLAPAAYAIGFTLDGHAWAIERQAPAFAVSKATRDLKAVALSDLATARTPLRDGSSWNEGGWSFTRLRGTPRVGIAPANDEKSGGPTVKLVGSGAKGYDAIVTTPPGEDFVLEGDLSVRGAPGGLAFRVVSGREAVRGAMLVITPGGRAALVTSDDAGTESIVGAPIDPAPAMPVHVKITVQGTKAVAVVGTTTVTGTLPATMTRGDVGLVAKRGGSVDLGALSLKKK